MYPRSLVVIAIALVLVSVEVVSAGEDESAATNTQVMDSDTKGRAFGPILLTVPVKQGDEIRCQILTAGGKKRGKGIGVALDAEIVRIDGSLQTPLGTQRGKIGRNGSLDLEFSVPFGTAAASLGVVRGAYSGGKKARVLQATCTAHDREPCVESQETLCLLDDRFKVEVDWRRGGQSGPGMVGFDGGFDGIFYFTNPGSQDLIVQLINSCSNNGHFWVFAGALTNIEYDLTVTDTSSGQTRIYDNPLGRVGEPILDTSAFATCP